MSKVFEVEGAKKRQGKSPGIYIQGRNQTYGPFASVGEALAFGEGLPASDWKMVDIS